MMQATIWHNPNCSTSRNALAMLKETSGLDVTVIDYRKQPFTRQKLIQLFSDAGLTPRQAMRTKGSLAVDLGITDGSSEDEILDAMIVDPLLVERPFVETGKGVRLGRPIERIAEIL